MKMKIAVIAFTEGGRQLIEKLKENLRETADFLEAGDTAPKDVVAHCFAERTPLLFVGACGIAVRMISPHLKDKLTDPPVLVMDEAGCFVIPILSGHVGGANDLAEKIASSTGAVPVITTATDVNQTFAIDEFARDYNLNINNREKIRDVSGKALRGEPIRIVVEESGAEADVVISENKPDIDALWLSPKKYVLGIGCKKGKTCGEIEALVEKALEDSGLTYNDIYAFGSIDLKAGEQGLLDFSAKHRIPFVTFTAEMLNKAPGEFSASAFVKETTGVDNVCERAAALLAGGSGTQVSGKKAQDGVTVSIARR